MATVEEVLPHLAEQLVAVQRVLVRDADGMSGVADQDFQVGEQLSCRQGKRPPFLGCAVCRQAGDALDDGRSQLLVARRIFPKRRAESGQECRQLFDRASSVVVFKIGRLALGQVKNAQHARIAEARRGLVLSSAPCRASGCGRRDVRAESDDLSVLGIIHGQCDV